jgi:hypothetical protein
VLLALARLDRRPLAEQQLVRVERSGHTGQRAGRGREQMSSAINA